MTCTDTFNADSDYDITDMIML